MVYHTIMAKSSMVEVANLRVDFGQTTVVKDLSFTVEKGQTLAFLGANGSGKTTTIRALLGIIEPVAGTLLIDGLPYRPDRNRLLGYLPEERGMYKKEPVLATMQYFGQLKGLSPQAARQWSNNYLEAVDLADVGHRRLETLSGGQQQKIQLGVTLMGDPELLILDEPTKGFDPVNRRLLLDMVAERSKAGATVILVTHQMEEVERLCDHVLLLKDGRNYVSGEIEAVRQQYGMPLIDLEFQGRLAAKATSYTIKRQTGRQAELEFTHGSRVADVWRELASQPQLIVTRFEQRQSRIDDIFLEIYRET
jgi:ABC-2 type transport system ATP-binding protein